VRAQVIMTINNYPTHTEVTVFTDNAAAMETFRADSHLLGLRFEVLRSHCCLCPHVKGRRRRQPPLSLLSSITHFDSEGSACNMPRTNRIAMRSKLLAAAEAL